MQADKDSHILERCLKRDYEVLQQRLYWLWGTTGERMAKEIICVRLDRNVMLPGSQYALAKINQELG